MAEIMSSSFKSGPFMLYTVNILFLYTQGITGENDICLHWTCGNRNLTLACEVQNPEFNIYIKNQTNKDQAYCRFFLNNTFCYSYNSYGSIIFNTSTNQAIYTVTIQDKPSANGKWTCTHGSGEKDPKADVQVNIGCLCEDDEGPTEYAEKEKGDCPMMGSITAISLVASYIIVTCILLPDILKVSEFYCCVLLSLGVLITALINHYKSGNCIVMYFVNITLGLFLGAYFASRLFIFKEGLTLQIAISFNGETLVKRYDKIHLNCSTDTIPVGNATDIKVNEKTYTTVTSFNGECFSTVLGKKCLPDICECSSIGLWFTHVYQANEPEGIIDIKCSMIFRLQRTLSDSFQVRIIDFTGPIITSNNTFPLPAGSDVKFICVVKTTVKIISIKWSCLGKENIYQVNGSTEHTSLILHKLHFRHDNQKCNCFANVDGIAKKASIHIKISKNPILQINESVSCSSSSPVMLYCSLQTELNNFGFNVWRHYIRGIFIREVSGINFNKQSTLHFGSCSYQDAGEYECIGWTDHSGAIFYANKTVSLFVNHLPLIISANVYREANVKLTVSFISPTNTTATWLRKDQPLINSTKMIQTSESTGVQLTFYNQSIDCDGFIVSLLFSENISAGEYVIVLKNDFGQTRQSLRLDPTFVSGATFDLRSVILGIASIGIFILTATFTAILSRGRQCNIIHIVGPHERSPTIPVYHSAPGCESNYHLYEGINPAYLDAIGDSNEYHYSDVVEYNDPNTHIRQHHYSDVEYNEPDINISHDHYEEVH